MDNRPPVRKLSRQPPKTVVRTKAIRLNRLLSGVDGESSYLEIGLGTGKTFENIRATQRWGVDPEIRFDTENLPTGVRVFKVSSDSFFRELPQSELFDLIYVDGLHTFDQTLRDINNALKHLAPKGMILIDDTLPVTRWSAWRNQRLSNSLSCLRGDNSGRWYGDVFRVIPLLRSHFPDTQFVTIVQDDRGAPAHGQTILWRTSNRGSHVRVSEARLFLYRFFTFNALPGSVDFVKRYSGRREADAIDYATAQAAVTTVGKS